MANVIEIKVPDIGDFKDVEVIEVLVKPGDTVAKEASLISLESDKATMEIPSSDAGTVKEIKVKVGDKVNQGSVILTLDAEGATAQPAAQPAAQTSAKAAETKPATPAKAAPQPAAQEPPPASPPPKPAAAEAEPAATSAQVPHASPSVRRYARELGVDLTKVTGSGPKGRILQEDVQGYVKGVIAAPGRAAAPAAAPGGLPFNLPDLPNVDFSKFGATEIRPLSRIKKLSGANLHRNWVAIPHVTQFDDADITDLEAFRKESSAETEKQGFKLTMLAFLIKACVTALRAHPDFNSSLDRAGENLVLKKYFHIGVAVDTPDGLVVPVIRDADRKGVFDLARELSEVSKNARDKKLKAADMQGGCFSISSLGGIGGTAFTPIINAPEVAILGVSRAQMKPVWRGDKSGKGEFVPRLMLPLSLSYDHRVIDGAAAARFTTYLVSVLQDIRRTLL
jgi:pyruvate dehydrogenase E2 component (dihydrolipoyllysine-residue acetyltransferase)